MQEKGSAQEIETTEGKMFDPAFDMELEYGVVIHPILKNEEQFRYWPGALPFYDNVQKEGIVVGW